MKEYEVNELDYENKMAARYNSDYHSSPLMLKHDEDFVSYVSENINEGDRVLDLGCGPASLWELMKKNFPLTDRMVGVDLSDEMIKVSKDNWPDDEFYVSSIFDLPFESGSFDVVIVSSILHHIPDNDLEEVFKEIYRILDEHGRIVGREPVDVDRLADKTGWFSGSIMHLRHLIYRLDKTREYPEPDIGEHHHAYDPKEFFDIIEKIFKVKNIKFRNPLSDYASRCKNKTICKLLEKLDEFIGHKKGQTFFYLGYKNFSTSDDVIYCIKRELEDNLIIENEKEFMSMIAAASIKIEELIKKDNKN